MHVTPLGNEMLASKITSVLKISGLEMGGGQNNQTHRPVDRTSGPFVDLEGSKGKTVH